MKIVLASVGKPHEALVKAGVEEFTQRIQKYYGVEWKIITPPKNAASLNEAALKKAEAELVLQQLQPDDFLILLDERGKNISSPELANLLQQRANESTK
ncbi:MAG TPA: 23S rRNA (pseudouridine(1915)-N(3))-methyltransferase RlmH, partial [Chitinophagaceae bacterium]|nr:23S rRNA (pseudouridine(1915)-N(3))-methyltransferase RlmH [Chitinophagaceae bacterium]